MSKPPSTPNSLPEAFNFTMREVLRYDFFLALLGGSGGAWLALSSPQTLAKEIPLAATVVGIVVGAVVAGMAVLAVFLDQAFLRKLRAIGREPVRYIGPFLFTAALGVVASLLLLLLTGLPATTPEWLLALVSGLAGFTVTWTLASVLPNLSLLVQFIGLQFDAADIPDLPLEQSRSRKASSE
jgi:hypothetical protein